MHPLRMDDWPRQRFGANSMNDFTFGPRGPIRTAARPPQGSWGKLAARIAGMVAFGVILFPLLFTR